MVSTRRMESSGSTLENGSRRSHSRRKINTQEEEEEAEDEGEEDQTSTNSNTEPSQEEESWSSQFLSQKGNRSLPPSRVRELRNRFVCGEHKFSPRRLRSQALRSCRSRVSLDERGRVYQPEEMHDESDDMLNGEEDSDEFYNPIREKRRDHARHTIHSTIDSHRMVRREALSLRPLTKSRNYSEHISSERQHSRNATDRHRMVRREALSLRPLKTKSYADHHEQQFSSGSDRAIRRSTRQKKLQYDTFNTSWITDAQMVKGYPNFDDDYTYQEDDSRHSQENSLNKSNRDESSREGINLRNGRREIKQNTKYIFDFDTSNGLRRRRTTSGVGVNRGAEEIKKEAENDEEKTNDEEKSEVTNEVTRSSRGSMRFNGKRNDDKTLPPSPKLSKESKVNGVAKGHNSVKKEMENSAEENGEAMEEDDDEDEEEEGDEGKDDQEQEEKKHEKEKRISRSDGQQQTKDNKEQQDNSVNKNDSEILATRLRRRHQQQQQQEEEEEENSDSEHEIRRLRSRRPPRNRMLSSSGGRGPRNREVRETRSNRQPTMRDDRRDKSSSSSEEEMRGSRPRYTLRQRKPKLQPFQIPCLPKHMPYNIITRRRHERRHKQPDSDSSSTDSDDLIRKPKPKRQNLVKTEHQIKSGSRSVPVPIDPETLDKKVRFSSIGGLDGHIQCLKEMVVLPMMYPDVFKRFQIQPPRGVLFHGPPGTGKTLIARALANECSFGGRKVAFFMRKGADLLSKWVGESEKQLRLLFEQAGQMRPSIIFFDELDGLAPVRMARQDQNHASIVSTLLALMDGLDNRGEVIVIGATNRIDAIDPALRRPGRFDRELFFPLPARKEREAILKVHVAQWSEPPSTELVTHLADSAAGYCGSDLRALCSEAVIQGFRRTYPQVYSAERRLQLDPSKVKVEKVDFLRARSLLVPAAHRVASGAGRKLSNIVEPLLQEPLEQIITLLKESYPHGTNPALASIKVSATLRPAQLLITGSDASFGQTMHIGPALLQHMEHVHAHALDLATLYRESSRSPEEAVVQVFSEARRNLPSVIYIPSIDQWWLLISETVKAIFLAQVASLDPNVPILLLATSDVEYKCLPEQVSSIFSRYRREVVRMSTPSNAQREAFFHPLVIQASVRPPRTQRTRPKTPPPLPLAPTPPPEPLSKGEMQKLYEREEETLTELRIFLRDMCKKLVCNKQFYMFTKPVDLEEVPDYTSIIKQPMDLETMMTKVDLHRYSSAREFLADIDLICQNALEYNPDKTPADKQIRHRACSLRDHAYALFKAEMDTDFEDQCKEIARKRRERKASVTQFLPAYIHTPSMAKQAKELPSAMDEALTDNLQSQATSHSHKSSSNLLSSPISSSLASRKKRPTPAWKHGYNSRRKKRRINRNVLSETPGLDQNSATKMSSDDESKENNPEICVLDSSLSHAVVHGTESGTEDGSIPDIATPVTPQTTAMDVTSPLSVNCDGPPVLSPCRKSLTSPIPSSQSRTNLNETMLSPSDLLNEPLDFDDIDDALKETIGENPDENVLQPVEISKEALDLVLHRAVSVTKDCTVMKLLDLYNQLGKVIRKYARIHERTKLPKDLHQELNRFSIELNPESPVK